MEGREELYNKLRQLYSGKEIKYDSFTIGRQIENLVNILIGEIVGPYKQESEVKIGKNSFDGRVKIGGGRSILYEIFAGNLSEFRYERLLKLVESTYFARKTYFLIIAHSFLKKDKERIDKLKRSIDIKKVNLSFMDHEALISLHRFCSEIKATPHYEDLKTLKGLFLQNLFEYSPIIRKESFDEALTSARQQYSLTIATLKAPGLKVLTRKYEEYELELRNLEELLEKALYEIRRLRKELLQGK